MPWILRPCKVASCISILIPASVRRGITSGISTTRWSPLGCGIMTCVPGNGNFTPLKKTPGCSQNGQEYFPECFEKCITAARALASAQKAVGKILLMTSSSPCGTQYPPNTLLRKIFPSATKASKNKLNSVSSSSSHTPASRVIFWRIEGSIHWSWRIWDVLQYWRICLHWSHHYSKDM